MSFAPEWPFSSQRRAEVLIAVGRLIFSVVSLLAISLDPSEPSRYARIAYTLLSVYAGYSFLLAVIVLRTEAPLKILRLPTHIFDLLLFSLFIFFTLGPTSPFFTYFIFSLFCAALRWGWRGTLWTAGGALLAFIGIGIYGLVFAQDPDFELNNLIIRSAYLTMIAGILSYLAAYEERLRNELLQLST
jgi:hypothetical protein